MEFHEKLQELRKSRGLTQEELAEDLYVSRTAVSKWESGRGYPSIDSLKEISKYFSVTIDDLLSGDKLIFIAEKENDSNIRNMCELLLGIVDVCSILLIVLPLYPNRIGEHIYSVNLFSYVETTTFHRLIRWGMYLALILLGILKIILSSLIFKLSASLLEPITDKRITSSISAAGESLTLIMTCVLSISIMFFILIAIMISAGKFVIGG